MNKELINFDEDKNEEVESNNPTQEGNLGVPNQEFMYEDLNR
jgi:hypothetical protein